MARTVSLLRFNDLHAHFREGVEMASVGFHALFCAHTTAMPNLREPLVNGLDAQRYQADLQRLAQVHGDLQIVPTVQLTARTSVDMIEGYARLGLRRGKLYPQNVTHNSAHGVLDYRALYPVFAAMERHDLTLLLHPEHPAPSPLATCLDWESEFLERIFTPLQYEFPKLRIVLEHITTQRAVEAVLAARPGVAATVTPHHLLGTLDDILARQLEPRWYCKPVCKLPRDRQALRSVVLTDAAGDQRHRFFLGSDSAPHTRTRKFEQGCAGCFTGPLLPALLLALFADDQVQLENFATHYGAAFYGLPTTRDRFELLVQEWRVPDCALAGDLPLSQAWPLFASGSILNYVLPELLVPNPRLVAHPELLCLATPAAAC